MNKLLKGGMIMLGLMAGCSPNEAAAEAASAEVATGKVAVVYFSWGGNTRFAAETIAKKTGAALFEIKAEKPYSQNPVMRKWPRMLAA